MSSEDTTQQAFDDTVRRAYADGLAYGLALPQNETLKQQVNAIRDLALATADNVTAATETAELGEALTSRRHALAVAVTRRRWFRRPSRVIRDAEAYLAWITEQKR